MALKQYFYIVLVPLKFIPKRTASFWQTIKIPNRFVLKICTGGFADYNSLLLCFTCSTKNLLNSDLYSLNIILYCRPNLGSCS